MSGFTNPSPATVRNYLKNVADNDFLLVHSLAGGLADALGHPLNARRSYILQRKGDAWAMVKSWEKPANHPY
jgi:hypothetical protein